MRPPNEEKVKRCLLFLNEEYRLEKNRGEKEKTGIIITSIYDLCKNQCIEEIDGRICPLDERR